MPFLWHTRNLVRQRMDLSLLSTGGQIVVEVPKLVMLLLHTLLDRAFTSSFSSGTNRTIQWCWPTDGQPLSALTSVCSSL